jgi:hypothetical protein
MEILALNQHKRTPDLSLFLKFVLVTIAYDVCFALALSYFEINLESPVDEMTPVVKLLTVIVVAPLFETWLIQYLPFKFIIRSKMASRYKESMLPYVLISACFFALLHYQSLWYIVYAFIPGVIFAYAFARIYKSRLSLKIAFWFTAGIHAATNAFAFIVDLFYNS